MQCSGYPHRFPSQLALALGVVLCAAGCGGKHAESSTLIRTDLWIRNDVGNDIFLREVARPQALELRQPPVLLVHGGGAAGLESFDLPVEGFSLAEDIASAGHVVYVMDVRGWGRSTRPPEMNLAPAASYPLVSSDEAVVDIDAVVQWILQNRPASEVVLIGWATGGHWAATYASRHPDKVSGLVLLNTLYSVAASWPLADACDDPERQQGYRLADRASLLGKWSASIPADHLESWRDPRVAEAYAALTIATDSVAGRGNPPSVRIPLGYFQESCRLTRGERLWDAGAIDAEVMVIRGGRDFWSRPEDVAALHEDLSSEGLSVEVVRIPEGTHYVFLDRPPHRGQFLDPVLEFLRRRPAPREWRLDTAY